MAACRADVRVNLQCWWFKEFIKNRKIIFVKKNMAQIEKYQKVTDKV